MAVLESPCPKVNMVAYLEKNEGLQSFMRIIDFLKRSSIHKCFSTGKSHLYCYLLVTNLRMRVAISEKDHPEPKPTPSPPHPSEANVEPQTDPSPRPSPSTHIPDSIPESSGGNHRGRKSAKAKPSVHTRSIICELPDDTWIYRILKECLKMWGQEDKRCSNERRSCDAKVEVEKDSTVSPDEGTVDQTEGRSATPTTPTPTPTMFGDDETIAQVLLNMSQAKAVSSEKGERSRDGRDGRKVQEDWKQKKDVKKASEGGKAIKTAFQIRRAVHYGRKSRKFLHGYNCELKEGFLQNKDAIASGNNLLQESFKDQINSKERKNNKGPAKVDVTEQGTKKRKGGHMKMIARKRKRPQPDVNSDDEHRKCLKIVTFEGTIDSEIMEKKSFISKLDKVSSPEGDYLVIHRANGNFRAFNYLLEVLHIFDRQDLFHLYNLMMEQYSEITLEGFELILWGDLKIMMESSTEDNDQSDFWSDQQDWKIVTWSRFSTHLDSWLELASQDQISFLVKDYLKYVDYGYFDKSIWFINAPCLAMIALAMSKASTKLLMKMDSVSRYEEGVDWTSHSEEEDYALMACNSSDTEITSCSKECKEFGIIHS
ncbi:hypothetical protein Tco_0322553 [Tanacetum coccineum]